MTYVNFILTIILVIALIYIVKKNHREEKVFQDNFIQSLKTLDKKIDSIIINKGDKEHIL